LEEGPVSECQRRGSDGYERFGSVGRRRNGGFGQVLNGEEPCTENVSAKDFGQDGESVLVHSLAGILVLGLVFVFLPFLVLIVSFVFLQRSGGRSGGNAIGLVGGGGRGE